MFHNVYLNPSKSFMHVSTTEGKETQSKRNNYEIILDLLVGNSSVYEKEVLRKNIIKRMRRGNKVSGGRWKNEHVTSMRKEEGQLAISTDCLL